MRNSRENPRTANRFLLWLLISAILLLVGSSIYFADFFILLRGLEGIIIFFILCGMLAIFNIVVFAPILWLIAKFEAKKTKRRGL